MTYRSIRSRAQNLAQYTRANNRISLHNCRSQWSHWFHRNCKRSKKVIRFFYKNLKFLLFNMSPFVPDKMSSYSRDTHSFSRHLDRHLFEYKCLCNTLTHCCSCYRRNMLYWRLACKLKSMSRWALVHLCNRAFEKSKKINFILRLGR